jgi:hypothetical protein
VTFGSSLTDIDYRDLERRSISRFWADAAHLRHLDHFDGKEMFHRKSNNADFSGILIPYYYPGSENPVTYRLRVRNPEIDGRNGKPKNKYLSAPGDPNRLYIPPYITRQMLQDDASIPIIFVEGEFKALALRGLAGEATAVPRFIPIGLSGIWNWIGTIEKRNNAHGKRVSVKDVIPDFDRINLVSRKVIIAFDQDEEGE